MGSTTVMAYHLIQTKLNVNLGDEIRRCSPVWHDAV